MNSLCFTKSHRLLKRPEFTELSRHGKRTESSLFIGVYRMNARDVSRLGVTVTKKVGCACVRNRIKRHAREYFRQHWYRLDASYDINIIAKRRSATANSEEIKRALACLFSKLEAAHAG